MANTARTRPRPAGSGRMSRPGASHGRRSPGTSPYARVRARRQPQKTGLAKLLERLPTAAAGKAAGSKKGKAGGFAALAAAGSLAFRNRDKLGGLMSRKRGQEPATPPRPEPPTPPSG